MALRRCALAGLLTCACAWAAAWTPAPADHPDDQPESAVALLQVDSRVQRRSAARAARQNVDVPSVVVDLDAEPELRWRNVTGFYKQLGVLPKAFVDNPALADADQLRLVRLLTWDEEHLREMRGYLGDLGLPEDPHLDLLKLTQVAYEVAEPLSAASARGCSALLAATPNGTVVHGRNMDYSGAEVEVNGTLLHYPEASLEGVFMRGGKPLYVSILWPGCIGIHTAMRFGGWSFQQNTRQHSARAALELGMRRPGSGGFMLAARRVMEATPDFDEAVERLYGLDLLGPSYFTVAGPRPYQGAVVTVDAGGEHDASTPPVTLLGSGSGQQPHDGKARVGWHVVQTNDDLNKMPLDPRRPLENLNLLGLRQDMVSVDRVFREMTSSPLYTSTTVFTSIFVPASGYRKTVSHPENGHGA